LAFETNYIGGINAARLDFIREHAKAIIEVSPIDYVKNAKLCGSLFDPEDKSSIISSADTGFFVDHTEPLEALTRVREALNWPLGDLLEGYEFFLMLEVRRRPRSRARLVSRPGPVAWNDA
jgi:hypothetical protein